MELGNLAEIAAVVFPMIAAVGGIIWWTSRTKATLDDHDKRIESLELETKTEIGELRKDIDDLKIEMIKGFAKLGVSLANKKDIDK